MRLDHAGVATDDAGGLASLFEELCALETVHEEEFDGMIVRFLDTGSGHLELLEPLEDGPIASYLDDRGPGIHHLAFETDDLVSTIERARALDVEPIDDEPRAGAFGHDVAFMHPGDTGGVLVEFVEH